MNPTALPLQQLLRTLKRHTGALALFSVALAVLLLMPTLYMLQVYDRVLSTRNEVTLAMLTLLALGVFALLAGIEALRQAVLVRLAARADRALAPAVFDAAITAPAGVSPGLVAADLSTLRQSLAGPLPGLLFDTPLATVFLLAAFVVDVWLGLFVAASIGLLAGLALWHERRARGPVAEAQRLTAASGAQLAEALRQAESARALGMQPALAARWTATNAAAAEHQAAASHEGGRSAALIRFVRLATQSLALGLGALLVLEQRITPGMMIAATLLLGRALAPVESLVGMGRQISALRDAWARLDRLLQAPPAAERIALPAARGALAAEALAWSPAAGQAPLVMGVGFELQPGEALGVVGPSGAGKSTLARLLVGALAPSAGRVRLDGAELAHWPDAQRAAALGYLPQDVDLFDGTVAENIARMGAVDPQQVVQAAQRAGVHEMVLRLPQGYETRLGHGGIALSGGQRQRLGLARALYGEPVLLVLDEPNAHLDEAGELALRQALQAHKARGGSLVVVSHRLPLLQVADKLLVMAHGRPGAFGPRDEVLRTMLRAVGGAAVAGGAGPAPQANQANQATQAA